jgi:hypothetical protein
MRFAVFCILKAREGFIYARDLWKESNFRMQNSAILDIASQHARVV